MIDGPISLGIIGLGFGRLILESLQKDKLARLFRVAAVCDLDEAKARETAAQYGVRVATLEEMLGDPLLSAVGIFTGPSGRSGLIQQAVRAGKHVMTTKPFSSDSRQATLALAEAYSLGRVVYLNSPSPSLPPDLALIRHWQSRYNLGEPVAAHASTWVRYAEKPDGTWYDDPVSCPCAPIFRLGIYLIHDLIEFFGEPETVHVMAARKFTGRPTPDNAQLALRFRDGGVASILASFCISDGDHYRNSLTLNFENGTVYRNAGPRGRAGAAGRLSLVINRNDSPVIAEEKMLDQISGDYPWAAFHNAIRSGETLGFDYSRKILAGLRTIEAMSVAEGTGLITAVSLEDLP